MKISTALRKAYKELSAISTDLKINRVQLEFSIAKNKKFDTYLTVFYSFGFGTDSNMTITVYNEIDFDCALKKALAEFESKCNPKRELTTN